MVIQSKIIKNEKISYIIRCPEQEDAEELSKLRVKIDGQTENLYRELERDYQQKKILKN